MKKSGNGNTGPRSVFSLLPFATRFKIITLLHDGATLDAVIADQDIAKAYERIGQTPARSSLSRVKQSAEFRRITAQREEHKKNIADDQMLAALIRENGDIDSFADQAKVELIRIVKNSVALSQGDTKELERLVRSVVNLSNPAKDKKISDLQLKLRELEEKHVSELVSKNAEIERLKSDIIRITTTNLGSADGVKVADKLNEILGVKK